MSDVQESQPLPGARRRALRASNTGFSCKLKTVTLSVHMSFLSLCHTVTQIVTAAEDGRMMTRVGCSYHLSSIRQHQSVGLHWGIWNTDPIWIGHCDLLRSFEIQIISPLMHCDRSGVAYQRCVCCIRRAACL